MLKRIIAFILLAFILLCFSGTAFAVEADEDTHTRSVFYINGVRAHFRVLQIAEYDFANIFDVASALSNTDARFSPRWHVRDHSLIIVPGQSFSFCAANLPPITPSVNAATRTNIYIFFNGSRFNLTSYKVDNSFYFNLSELAALLDIGLFYFADENTVQLVTYLYFMESLEEPRALNPFRPVIALTFDDGPSRYTTQILDALEYHGAVATFYVTANRLERHIDIANRIHAMGNEIANHTWSHPRLTSLSDADIRAELHAANIAISEITGTTPASLRPTFGAYDERVAAIAREFGLPLVLWSLDTNDWYTRDSDSTFYIVMENVRNGDIILMHDLHEPTAHAAVRLIPALIEQGFQLVTVSELFYHFGVTPQPGGRYESGFE